MVKFKRLISLILVLLISLSVVSFAANAKAEKKSQGDEIVAYAKTFIGHRYVHGGAGPNVFDCSGFVKYVFGHFGYNFPHTTSFYRNIPAKYGHYVSEKDAKPGDIVSWRGHVGIYIGDGKVVNALSPRYGVCEWNISTFRDRYGVNNPPHLYIRVSPAAKEENKKAPATVNLGKETVLSFNVKKKYIALADANCCLSEDETLWKMIKKKGNKYLISDLLENCYLSVTYNDVTGEYNLHATSKASEANKFSLEKKGKKVLVKDNTSGLYIATDKKSNNIILKSKGSALKIKEDNLLINDIKKPADMLKTAEVMNKQEIVVPSEDKIDNLNSLDKITSLKPHLVNN